MVVEKPFGTTSQSAHELNRALLSRVRRAPGLPDRPLPGQGDGPEHAGAALRATASSSRSGTATTSTTCRSPRPRTSASARAPSTTTTPARCATWCRTTCSSCSTLLSMEPPVSFSADEVRDEKVKVLHAIKPPPAEEVPELRRARPVRAGRGRGQGGAGLPRGGGRAAGLAPPRPTRPLRLTVDNWRWAGVPIYLRTGKRLARKTTEIAVTLKPVPHLAFQQSGSLGRAAQPAGAHRAAQRGRLALARGEDPRRADARPAGEHGVPLRHVVHVAVARGLRAADPRHHARRRHAVRTRRRGGGRVVDRRPDPPGVVAGRRARCPSTRPARRARRRRTRCTRTWSGGRCDRQTV